MYDWISFCDFIAEKDKLMQKRNKAFYQKMSVIISLQNTYKYTQKSLLNTK
jgi:hypothetical protein